MKIFEVNCIFRGDIVYRAKRIEVTRDGLLEITIATDQSVYEKNWVYFCELADVEVKDE